MTLSIFIALPVLFATAHDDSLVLVSGQTSPYRIYCDPGAPASVKRAAGEVQRVIEVSTGVRLPVTQQPASPMVALGDSDAAREAGLVGEEIPFEGFRIVTKGRDVFIVGHDVPKGQEKWFRQWSYGTLYGANTFLEKVVGVRWLMPGPMGEDIPKHTQLTVPVMDLRQAPCFRFRALAYVQGRYNEVVKAWKVRHKIHEFYRVSFPHVFDHFPHRDVLVEHPEYMAMQSDGVRQDVPEGETGQHQYCLTNPGLQKAFADAILDFWQKRPDRMHATMSPNDSSRFCECPRCQEITERDDGGLWGNFAERGWSITPALLQFYNAVGRHVRKRDPVRIVGGHIYRSYTYPPQKLTKVAPNVVLNIAALDHYGYKLYKPERAAEFRRLYPAWAKFTTRLGHSDYSTWTRDWYGLPLPPGKPILKLMFPILKRHQVMLINYTGHASWGVGAVHNYVVGKLLWDGDADVDALYGEFLRRAYGPRAAPHIDRIYTISEQALSRYIRDHPGFRQPPYNVTYELVAKYYAPRFPEIEKLYSAAWDATDTEPQRERLNMFGEVLTLLHYNLQCAGLVKEPRVSRFYKTEDELKSLMAARTDSLTFNKHQKPSDDRPMRFLFSPESRVLQVPFLPPDAAPPAIDGQLGDAAWSEAALATGFRLRGRREKAGQQTEARLLFDREHLYLAARCLEAEMPSLKASVKGHDSPALFNDDTFELFIGHRPNFAETYWHVAFNPNAAWYDNVALERDYNLKFEHATSRDGASWSVEAAIPLKNLGRLHGPPFGKTWRGNFCRTRKSGDREVSSWASIEEGFHDPNTFGEWRFAAKP